MVGLGLLGSVLTGVDSPFQIVNLLSSKIMANAAGTVLVFATLISHIKGLAPTEFRRKVGIDISGKRIRPLTAKKPSLTILSEREKQLP